ncbi:hypothetical protein NDU88_005816 [Pleurodeles waltl]|uniref:Uncharacterized protein n=1 Tax=Pleurodeles waltl TaxID=8319 RepID=A0AAV7TBI7_PLEWA|nr:hypothetical protein NDU88_005816 [Pleurodeles waltl]
MQRFGACVSRGKIPSTHGRFLLGFQCRVKADSPQSMHHQETVEKAGRIRRYNVAGSHLATLLQFAAILEQSAVDPWQKSKREMQRNSGELSHSLSEEKPTGETLNSPQRMIGHLTR